MRVVAQVRWLYAVLRIHNCEQECADAVDVVFSVCVFNFLEVLHAGEILFSATPRATDERAADETRLIRR